MVKHKARAIPTDRAKVLRLAASVLCGFADDLRVCSTVNGQWDSVADMIEFRTLRAIASRLRTIARTEGGNTNGR